MINAVTDLESVHHVTCPPGDFPGYWLDTAHELHRRAWSSRCSGQLDRERFGAELAGVQIDALFDPTSEGREGRLLAYVKWKATDRFFTSRDELSSPELISLAETPPARYVCAYEITATTDASYRGLGRRLLGEALNGWGRTHAEAVFCTYSPKRNLTTVLRRLAQTEQYGRPALEALAHRAGAVASRRIGGWIERLGRPLEAFILREIVPTPDEKIMQHLASLREEYGEDVVDGAIASVGIAYNFVIHARNGRPACGPAAFHRSLGAEHWRQYAVSATNCADALGLVDHWRYSHDPKRRATCASIYRERCDASAQADAAPDELLVLA